MIEKSTHELTCVTREYGVNRDRSADSSPMTLRERLIEAIAILDALPDQPSEEHVPRVARLYDLLNDVHRSVPKVELWCAVKFYRENLDGEGTSWKPAPWTGHLSKAQAEEYAPAIQAHYSKPYDHGDRFRVVRRRIDIQSVVPATCDVKTYINRRLAR